MSNDGKRRSWYWKGIGVWSILCYRRRVVFYMVFICVLVAVIITVLTKPVYRSRVEIQRDTNDKERMMRHSKRDNVW